MGTNNHLCCKLIKNVVNHKNYYLTQSKFKLKILTWTKISKTYIIGKKYIGISISTNIYIYKVEIKKIQ